MACVEALYGVMVVNATKAVMEVKYAGKWLVKIAGNESCQNGWEVKGTGGDGGGGGGRG